MASKSIINNPLSTMTLFWAISGITLFLGGAIIRLLPNAIEALRSDLTYIQWLVAASWLIYMLATEGYYGFQKRMAPRFAARTLYVITQGTTVERILSPVFCIGYFGTIKKRLIVIWSLTVGIVVLIMAVRLLSEPWRGIIDLGVIAGVGYGLITVYVYTFKTIRNGVQLVDPELVKT